MPKMYERYEDAKKHYPNESKSRRWAGCPMTCPDYCPYSECTMPPEIAELVQHPVWHGWVINEEGWTVMESKQYGKRLKRRKA